jgi:allophanate hydrolase
MLPTRDAPQPLTRRPDPRGSSSGSAVAVATGIVPLALGTDTAGSGRVPAALNNIIGCKPSRGLVSTHEVVPACRSLDCVSVFALTAADAFAALRVIAGPDRRDPYSRDRVLGPLSALPPRLRVGVPRQNDRIFLGDQQAKAAFAAAERIAQALGGCLVPVDLSSFFATAGLLYQGPYLAERTAAVGDFIAREPAHVHPITRQIIAGGYAYSAVDLFRCQQRLLELRALTANELAKCDVLMLPSIPQTRDPRRSGGRSDRRQHGTGHLYQFCKSARHGRVCLSGVAGAGRHGAWDELSCAGGA